VLETCRYLEKIYTKKELCVKLVIYKNRDRGMQHVFREKEMVI